MAIHLGRSLLNASSNQPGWRPGNRLGTGALRLPRTCHPYSVLLPAGFAVPRLLPDARCALTAPFHPYRGRIRGGLLSVALSLRLPPPDVIRRCVSAEPGLSSACKKHAAAIQPADFIRITGKLFDKSRLPQHVWGRLARKLFSQCTKNRNFHSLIA
jgi:hypothetical protein